MNETANRLPSLLKVLLILSFVGSGFGLMQGLQDALSKPTKERVDSFKAVFDAMEENPETDAFKTEWFDYVERINLNIVNYGVARFMFSAFSLIGVFLMYRRLKKGFFIYTGAQILLLSVPIFFGGYSGFSVALTFLLSFISMVFIVLYSSQLKHMA